MKKIFLTTLACLISLFGYSQAAQKNDVKKFQTIIYTSDNLASEIQRENDQQDNTRRFMTDLLTSTASAAKGIGSGYVTSFINMGVNAIASLITKNSRQKQEWEEMVNAENSWSTSVNTVQDVKDFYKNPSQSGALDPMGMMFDGIGCLQMDGKDTIFFMSSHINRNKLNRIVNHSKFELILDTLYVSPTHSNLPNTQLPLSYSLNERKDFNLSVNIKIFSSWFTQLIEMHSDEQLGEFTISVPVNELNANGYMKYIRKKGEEPKYEIVGESFIVPRSYMGYRDKEGRYKNIWGTGQYKLNITLSETCNMTDEYRKNWKADMEKRNEMTPKNGFFPTVWQTVTKQKWNEITQQWVITTLSAPAGVISNELIEDLGLSTTTSSSTTPGAQQAR